MPEKRNIDELLVRVRDNYQACGVGTSILFKSDKLEGLDPAHISAIDKMANWISQTMDDSGPSLEELKKGSYL